MLDWLEVEIVELYLMIIISLGDGFDDLVVV